MVGQAYVAILLRQGVSVRTHSAEASVVSVNIASQRLFVPKSKHPVIEQRF